jgi:S1-C subfamily serine protease
MANKKTKNNSGHPAVIVAVLILVFVSGFFLLNKTQNPSQSEIDALKTEVENLKSSQAETTQKPRTNPSAAKANSLADIVAQWHKSTAYVECYWINSNTRLVYFTQSGSGLLFMKGTDLPTIVTNKHVVSNSQYGTASECDAAFPDDKYAFNTINNVYRSAYTDYTVPTNPLSIPAIPTNGQIRLNDTKDVAFLSGFEMNDGDLVPPTISLENRAVRGKFPCASEPNIGDPLVILGYPSYGSGAGTITSVLSHLEITATEGIISGKDSGYYTTSAKIEHGNSGGLAVDKTNNCYLGIPTASFTGEIESLGRILPASYIFKY